MPMIASTAAVRKAVVNMCASLIVAALPERIAVGLEPMPVAAVVAAIHGCLRRYRKKSLDARDKRGHDVRRMARRG